MYLAPELLTGGEATVRSDVYGIGVLLYHLLTGSYPVQARSIADLRSAHARGDRTDLRTARPNLPPKLVRIIGRAIDPEPQRRQQNAVALAADLAALKPRPRLVPLAYAAGVAAALVLAVWIAANMRGRQTQGPSRPVAVAVTGSAAFSPVERPIIAVLPLKNLSDEPDSEFFVDGLTDELIRNLAVIDGLDVRSQTSSFAFKGKPRNLREVGEQLGANLVVEGSVLRSGNRLRINAQLVQVAGDVPLWSERFNRELKDVFAIQDEIARAIVNRLRLTLGRGQRRYDTNLEAYELYLEARAMVTRQGTVSAQKGAALFERVIEKDAGFAPAYAGLADAYAFMAMEIRESAIAPELALARMRPAALKALELDPLLPEGHAAMGHLYSRERDWANAQKSFERAIELNPTLTHNYTGYARSTLIPLGKIGDAERLVLTALGRDPLSLNAQLELATLQMLGARYEEAVENFRRIEAVEPDFPFLQIQLARALSFAGRLSEAVPRWEKHRHQPGWQHWMAYAFVKAGRRAEIERIAATHDHPYRLAIFYSALGDHDRALAALDRAADIVPHRVGMLLRDPETLPLRGDPRFAAICRKLGLP